MNLKSITLSNFKCFRDTKRFAFTKINLIDGPNGVGKTTLGLDSILFALYGYSNRTLSSLVTKGLNNCKVIVEFDNYTIAREYPTKITITPSNNNEPLTFANNIIAQNWINNKFGKLDYFLKFRLIDVNRGINILEEGKISLQKTLFNIYQDIFNDIRQKLLDKKREREIYCRDKVIYTHYPSQKRLNYIDIKILELTEEIYNLQKEIYDMEQGYIALTNKKTKLETTKGYYNDKKNKLIQYSTCPTCNRIIDDNLKNNLLKDINSKIININTSLQNLVDNIIDYKEIIEYLKSLKNNLDIKRQKLNQLKLKLETRIKQKDFKYSTKDVLIIKKAIDELDNFCSYYITDYLKTLEPIINDVLSKINFNIKFIIDKKGNLDLELLSNGRYYDYKDLSTGQKLILSIAFKLAILLERNDIGLIIADEGLTNLDYDNLNYIIELFKDLPYQLIFMLHRYDDVPESVHVIKLKGAKNDKKNS